MSVLAAGLLATAAEGAQQGKRKKSPRLHAFRSCSNLVGYAQRNGVRVIRDSFVPTGRGVPPVAPPSEGGAGGDGGTGGGREGGGPVAPPAPAPAAGGGESPTNVQEAGVDEPDIVKAAGTLVYVVADGDLKIVDAGASPPRVVGTLELPGSDQDLLLHGDRLLVIARLGGFSGGPVPMPVAGAAQRPIAPPSEWLGRTRLVEVDVSDPAAPRVLRRLDAEGDFVNARLTGATARIVIATQPRGLSMPRVEAGSTAREVRRDWRRSVRRSRTASWLPASVLTNRRTGRKQRRSLVRCRQVRRTQQFTGLGTLTVLTVDLQRGLTGYDADSLMTSGETVYASQDRLYVASERWLGDDPSRREVLDDAATGLHGFDTTKPGETSYVGSGEVPGYLLSQWSLSEHEGVLRVATTSMPPWGSMTRSESAVRTLEERGGRLVEIGRAGGLGKGERIYAVRFMGALGFVVTFRQVDPLYTLDLSDPRAPRVVGELKIPGYSAYLHPVAEGRLLGVGQDATEEGRTTGVQLSLFDVRDLADPLRIAQLGLGRNSYTAVEDDHHAFTWIPGSRLAVIPMYRFDESEFRGAVVARIADGAIEEIARIAHPGPREPLQFDRSLVIGDRLLLVSGAGLLSTPLAAPGAGDFVAF
jgi:hypothetical protein